MGRHFIVGYMVNFNFNDPLIDVELYVSTSTPTDVSVRVTAPAYEAGDLIDERFTVHGGHVHRVVIPAVLIGATTERNNKAIEIKATEEVVAYGFNKQPYSNDGFLALPVDNLGTSCHKCLGDRSP